MSTSVYTGPNPFNFLPQTLSADLRLESRCALRKGVVSDAQELTYRSQSAQWISERKVNLKLHCFISEKYFLDASLYFPCTKPEVWQKCGNWQMFIVTTLLRVGSINGSVL
jgi:hypothetical protein